ncbi:MAG: ZIP family metal transporter [Planctomycetota bacterium]|nr:ZIP family metal transporter [Planctomycetota bacterium]
METLTWIVGSGLIMVALSMIGSVTLLLKQSTLEKVVLPLVAFSAGSLLGGAFLHMIPAAIEADGPSLSLFVWILVGFTFFLLLEQYLHWHHAHTSSPESKEPLTYLILVGDALHNFIGGIAVAGAFLIDTRLGVAAWLAAAAHEVPQELGDFGVLLHGGWSKSRALVFNALSGTTFLIGGIITYMASSVVDVTFLVPFAAGNFIYVAASDLVPEVNKHHQLRENMTHLASFIAGIALLLVIRLATEH